jgi:hypothetical protein
VIDPADSPILVLGSGHRTGSTLVQRLLISHPEVMIWGEHGGFLRKLLEITDSLEWWATGAGAEGSRELDAGGHDGWIANAMPGPEVAQGAARAFVRALFEQPASARGRSRWGFKEVRMTQEHAGKLRRLFAGLTVIHITRDPRRMLSSLDSWERMETWWPRRLTEEAVEFWVTINESFLARPDWVLSVRYEDVVEDPDRFIAAVAAITGLSASAFDRSVFDRKVRGFTEAAVPATRRWEELPRSLRGLVKTRAVREVAAAYGYEL